MIERLTLCILEVMLLLVISIAHGHVRIWLKWISMKDAKDLKGQSLGNSYMNVEVAKKSVRSCNREKDVGL